MPTVGMTYVANDDVNSEADNQDLLPLLSVPVGGNTSDATDGEGPMILVGDTAAAGRDDYVGAAKGCLLIDSEAGKLYVNTGSSSAATWTLAKDIT